MSQPDPGGICVRAPVHADPCPVIMGRVSHALENLQDSFHNPQDQNTELEAWSVPATLAH